MDSVASRSRSFQARPGRYAVNSIPAFPVGVHDGRSQARFVGRMHDSCLAVSGGSKDRSARDIEPERIFPPVAANPVSLVGQSAVESPKRRSRRIPAGH